MWPSLARDILHEMNLASGTWGGHAKVVVMTLNAHMPLGVSEG